MRNLALLLLLALAASVGACGDNVSKNAGPHIAGAALGSEDQVIKWVTPAPTITLTSATTTTIFDTTGGDVVRQRWTNAHRFLVTMRCSSQDVTLLYQIKRTSSTTWRTFNGFTGTAPSGHCTGFSPGAGAGDTVKADTDTGCDFLVLGPDSRFQVTTGGTGPGACEVDIGYYAVRSLGM